MEQVSTKQVKNGLAFCLFVMRLVLLFVITFLISFGSCQQWPFAIGNVNQIYANYQIFSFTSQSDVDSFVTVYNNFGSIPSLGTTPTSNCQFNFNWAGRNIYLCGICPSQIIANNYYQLTSAPGTPNCYSSVSDSIILPSTNNPNGQLAVFKSTIPSNCNPQCTLHGACTSNSCVCPTVNNITTVGWTGTNCQIIVPPKGYKSYFAQVSWAPIASPETFSLSLSSSTNCTWYVSSMPSEYSNSPLIPVSEFQFTTTELYFQLVTPAPSQLMMGVYIVAPDDAYYCAFGQVYASTVGTLTTLTFPGEFPVTLSSGVAVLLNNY